MKYQRIKPETYDAWQWNGMREGEPAWVTGLFDGGDLEVDGNRLIYNVMSIVECASWAIGLGGYVVWDYNGIEGWSQNRFESTFREVRE